MASIPKDLPTGLEQTVGIMHGYCEMVTGNCKGGADIVAKAYKNAFPDTVTANMDTYCPIAGTLDQRLGRIRAQLGAFVDHRYASPSMAWCNHLVAPAKAAAKEAQSDAQRTIAAKNLQQLAWCMSTAGRCGEARELSSLAVATDADGAAWLELSTKCP